MCLIRVTQTHNPPLELEAWKVFVKEPGGGLRSPFFRGDFVREAYPEGQWIDAGRPAYNDEPSYRVGFHAFVKEKDARRHAKTFSYYFNRPLIARKVKLRGVHTSGTDFDSPCYVAQEMLIASESEAGEDTNGL